MNKFIKYSTAIAAIGTMLALAMPVGAATPTTAPGQNKLQCFDPTTEGTAPAYGGTCTLNSKGAKGAATLSLNSINPNGDYAGVYTDSSSLYGALLTNVTQLSFNYTSTIVPQPGDLSYNIPIDSDGDGTTDFYAFVDVYYCSGTDGTVNIVSDANCGIWANGTFYSNWSALVGAYPGAKIAMDNFVFIVAERTPSEPAAVYTVNNVKFGKAGK